MSYPDPAATPFALACKAYLDKGWSPIPLPFGKKVPPPSGWTGYVAQRPSLADLLEWSEHGYRSGDATIPAGNIAIRLGEDVVGIDVDQYGEKKGADELARLERELGPLPPTYVSTSRDDGVSGIRFYRVRRTGRAWADTAGPAIEVIHHGHRYAVVAPSIHPSTDRAYRWLGLEGRQCAAPFVSDLPLMPQRWEERLDVGDVSSVAAKAHISDSEALVAVQGYPDGPMCKVLLEQVERAKAELTGAASRHDTCRDIVGAVVRAGERGHHGSRDALVAIHDLFVAALKFGERRDPDAGEFNRMVAGAVKMAAETPTKPEDVRCCGSVHASFPSFDPELPEPHLEFWGEREALDLLRGWSRSRMTSPWATLLAGLCRVCCWVPPRAVLPAIVGGAASLNLFAALVGPSGSGKGAAEAVADEALSLAGHDVFGANVGSGEGIAHAYAHRVKGEVVMDREAVLFSVQEVDSLTALGNRQGSTLLSQLRSAWTGERLGFAYADATKRIPLEAHAYRMCLVLGVQPGRAGPLLGDSDGGTPQRFVWVWVTDPHGPRPDALPETPSPLAWQWSDRDQVKILSSSVGNSRILFEVSEAARSDILDNRYSQQQGSTDAIDGHLMLCRLKVAAALGVLDGRLSVTDDDWRLSQTVMTVSSRTRDSVQASLTRTREAADAARGRSDGRRQSVAEETLWVAKVARVSTRILTILESGRLGEGVLTNKVSSRDRDAVPEALEALEKTSRAAREDQDGHTYWERVGQ